MKSICLLRHGPVVNPENRIYGWRDVELRDPPERILDVVSPNRIQRVTAIVTSDLQRCRSAAECLAIRYGIPLIVSDCIREQSFGDWEGMTWNEVKILRLFRIHFILIGQPLAIIYPSQRSLYDPTYGQNRIAFFIPSGILYRRIQ